MQIGGSESRSETHTLSHSERAWMIRFIQHVPGHIAVDALLMDALDVVVNDDDDYGLHDGPR